jgi:hypothetical protein
MYGYSEVFTPDGPVFTIFTYVASMVNKVREDDNYSYEIDPKEILFTNVKDHKPLISLSSSQLEDWTAKSLSELGEKIIPKIFLTARHYSQFKKHS